MKNNRRRQLSMPDALLLIDELVDEINKEKKTYTHVMGVSRGGLIPAVYLSHAFSLPLALTSYSSPQGKGDGSRDQFAWQDDKNVAIGRDSRVLVVDDIIDSGFTMTNIIGGLSPYVSGADYVALFEKDGAIKPEHDFDTHGFVGEILDEDSGRIVFPWERGGEK